MSNKIKSFFSKIFNKKYIDLGKWKLDDDNGLDNNTDKKNINDDIDKLKEEIEILNKKYFEDLDKSEDLTPNPEISFELMKKNRELKKLLDQKNKYNSDTNNTNNTINTNKPKFKLRYIESEEKEVTDLEDINIIDNIKNDINKYDTLEKNKKDLEDKIKYYEEFLNTHSK